MFKITHGQHKGLIVESEDQALVLLSPEDLANGGYVYCGSGSPDECRDAGNPAIDGSITIWQKRNPIDGSTIVGLMKNIDASGY